MTQRRTWSATGFTLIELVIIIVVLGIISTVAFVKYSDFVNQSRIEACEAELATLKRAIVGNAQVTAGGRYTDVGFEGNIGSPPNALVDLARKPDSLTAYNAISRLGWNGPYIDSANGDYLKDPWGVNYVYERANRRIKSTGSGSDIILTF